jgi:alkylation response protein AidB-like acyl-CoA dehydrogenase
MQGEVLATLAHEEADSHYDPAHVATRATREAEGWCLQGAKAAVPFGAQAQWLILSARTQGEVADTDGIGLFALPADTPGLRRTGSPTLDGSQTATVHLDQVRLPASALIGPEGRGHALLEQAIGRGILALCAEALGLMEAAKAATITHLQTRMQFGQPLARFQALQHRMASLLIEVEQARSAVVNAAAALDGERLAREKALSAAKHSIGRIGTLVAEACVQLHGGIGMTWELPLAHMAKRLILIDHQLGDEDHHLARFIALGQPA